MEAIVRKKEGYAFRSDKSGLVAANETVGIPMELEKGAILRTSREYSGPIIPMIFSVGMNEHRSLRAVEASKHSKHRSLLKKNELK